MTFPGHLVKGRKRIAKKADARAPAQPAAKWRVSIVSGSSRLTLPALLLLLAMLVVLPGFASRNALNSLIFVFYLLVLAQLWNLLAGYVGLVSVGQQAFVGLGGYSLFALTTLSGLDPLAAVLLAVGIAGFLALPTALILFRLRGAYFAIGSWVMAEIFRLVLAQFKQLGGGTGTSLSPSITNQVAGVAEVKQLLGVSSPAAREIVTYWVALALAVATIALVYALLRSPRGLALAAMRDSEEAAAASGVDIVRNKLLVYVIAAAGTGMAGALIYFHKARISPDAAFSVVDWTALVIFTVVIGGIGTIEGPIIGVIILAMTQSYLAAFGTLYLILLGGLAIAVMLFAPKGLWGFIAERFGISLFPIRRRLVPAGKPGKPSRRPSEKPKRSKAGTRKRHSR
jgi:branched-chain amino acid transport system permease protein